MKTHVIFAAALALLGARPATAVELDTMTTMVMDLDTKDIDAPEADGITIGDLSGGVGTSASDGGGGGPIVMQFVQQPSSGASTGTASGSRYVAPVARR